MKAELEQALSEIAAIHSALTRIESAIEEAVKSASNSTSIPLEPVGPVTDHRRAHRPGIPFKIDGDPELRTFLTARIGRMTFVAMEKEVATQFPEKRRVGKSAIHAWARRSGLIPQR